MLGWSIRASACRSASNRASHLAGVHARLDDFERDPASDGSVLLGDEDEAQAALADPLHQLVGADHHPFFAGAGFIETGRRIAGRSLQEVADFEVGANQAVDLRAQLIVGAAGLIQVGCPSGGIFDFNRPSEDGLGVAARGVQVGISESSSDRPS